MLAFLTLALATESCKECHPTTWAEWRGSAHARAATNPIFLASWEHWPNGWCLTCHAPRKRQQLDLLGRAAVPGLLHQLPERPPGVTWKDGVDCLTCHDEGGVILTATEPSAAAESAHPMRQDPALATEQACASCHEFPFQKHTPRFPFQYGSTLAQSTVSEWRGSKSAASKVCQDCHLGEQGHRMPGAHNVEFVRAAVDVQAKRKEGRLVLTVRHRGGHALPTGDPFRRLELWLCNDAACREPRAVAWYRRSLALTEDSWAVDQDLRVPADGERTVRVALDGATHWQLEYRYGDRRFESVLKAADVGFTVASGAVP